MVSSRHYLLEGFFPFLSLDSWAWCGNASLSLMVCAITFRSPLSSFKTAKTWPSLLSLYVYARWSCPVPVLCSLLLTPDPYAHWRFAIAWYLGPLICRNKDKGWKWNLACRFVLCFFFSFFWFDFCHIYWVFSHSFSLPHFYTTRWNVGCAIVCTWHDNVGACRSKSIISQTPDDISIFYQCKLHRGHWPLFALSFQCLSIPDTICTVISGGNLN